MIYVISGEREINKEMLSLSLNNPFGCRIISLYRTYNYNLPFVDFWVQIIDSKPVSLISRLDSSFVLRLTDNSDLEEISSFIRMSGSQSIICDDKYMLDINYKKLSGPILFSDSTFEIDKEFDTVVPNAKDVYSIISEADSENFKVPSYESFMLDVNNKINQKTARMYAVNEEKPVACIMTLAESQDCAVLGALATSPAYRKSGYGAYLIKYINNVLINEGKKVFLHRASDENITFYNKLGFKQFGCWAEYRD